jgi:hypothetical protein
MCSKQGMSTVGRIRKTLWILLLFMGVAVRTGESQISSEVLSVLLQKRKNSDWDPESDETPRISFQVHEIKKYKITELANESATKREKKNRVSKC